MTKKWRGLHKVVEECGELIQELMKLHSYPHGKHPRRKRPLQISTQEEAGDVMGLLQYFIEVNRLDDEAVRKRAAMKYRKYCKRYGPTPAILKAKKKTKKKTSKRRAKNSPQVEMPQINASSIDHDAKTT